MNQFIRRGPCVLALLASFHSAFADVVTRKVALSGEQVGVSAIFDSFLDVRITSEGGILFTARLAAAAGAGDECSGALPVALGGNFISTVGATDGASLCPTFKDVWFSF